jgi:hypothetical protein
MRVRWQFSLLLVFLLFGAVLAPAQTSHKMTKADIDRWMTELSNWGRWGKDDQLGTLNLITPAKRKEAAALVKEGYSISLAHDVLTEKAVDNESPFVHTMLPPNNGFQIDNYSVSFHGMGSNSSGCFMPRQLSRKNLQWFPSRSDQCEWLSEGFHYRC